MGIFTFNLFVNTAREDTLIMGLFTILLQRVGKFSNFQNKLNNLIAHNI